MVTLHEDCSTSITVHKLLLKREKFEAKVVDKSKHIFYVQKHFSQNRAVY
jgi:hypothetical protein